MENIEWWYNIEYKQIKVNGVIIDKEFMDKKLKRYKPMKNIFKN